MSNGTRDGLHRFGNGDGPARGGGGKHGGRQQTMLDLEHARGESVGRIVRQHRDPRLPQHRSTVVRLVDQVHRGSALPRPARQDRLVHPAPVHAFPAEGGEQRRVNVQNAIAEAGDDGGRNQLEITGEDDELGPVSFQPRQPLGGVGRIGEDFGGHPVFSGPLQRSGIRAVGQHQDDPRRSTRTECAQQRLEVAAAPRDGHGDAHCHGRRR
jgi:hypothetical protein